MKTIYITPFYSQKNYLNKLRKDEPFSDEKMIDKSTLIKMVLGEADANSILYIMRNYHLNYEVSSSIIKYLPFVKTDHKYESEKLKQIQIIKNNLISHNMFSSDDYVHQLFKNKLVVVNGYQPCDKELNYIFELLNINPTYNSNKRSLNSNVIKKYKNIDEEVLACLNSIAKHIDSGIDVNKINIYADEEYLYYLDKYSDDFGYKVATNERQKIGLQDNVKQLLNEFRNGNPNIESLDDLSKDVINRIITNLFFKELNKEQQLEYLTHELNKHYINTNNYKDVVRVINQPIFDENKYVFVLGFRQNKYPLTYKDNDYLSDQEKRLINMNDSLISSLISKEDYVSYFTSNNNFEFYFSESNGAGKNHFSSLVSALKLKEETSCLDEWLYSKGYARYYLSKELDNERLFLKKSGELVGLKDIIDCDYLKYDNSYTYTNVYNISSDILHSYSSINQFYNCPFSYYLDRVIKVDDFTPNLYSKLGNIAHYIFEHLYDDDFDFDTLYLNASRQNEVDEKESVLIGNIKDYLLSATKAIKDHSRYMNNPTINLEEQFVINLSRHAKLSGIIDKSILIDNRYIYLIDYKTGSDDFAPDYLNYGYSMQLPTYALLIHSDDRYKDLPVAGMFINSVGSGNEEIIKENELIYPSLKLKGKADPDLLPEFDKTILDGNSCFVYGFGFKKDGTLKKSNSISSLDELKHYEEIVLEKYLEADKMIRNNGFLIKPRFIGSKSDPCKYCKYKDICYLREYQKEYIASDEEDE